MITDGQLRSFYVGQYPVQQEYNQLNLKLWDDILSRKPESVFEFGCNCGKNLFHMRERDPKLMVAGCDISERAISAAMVDNLICGGIDVLKSIAIGTGLKEQYDISFSCSVFCHMNEIKDAINAMKMMSKTVLLLETNDKRDWNYIAHQYESFGFKPKWNIKSHPGNECIYTLFEFKQ